MHAIRQHAFGPAENLRYELVDDLSPGPGQVRIEVSASGVHLIDTKIREGMQGGPFPQPELPMTPGREVAGVVDVLGDGVDPDWLGRRVVAHLGQANGGYAELAVAEAGSLHALPDALAEDAAVAMIGTGRTTLGVLDAVAVTGDDVLLVTAAAGGIGSLVVQLAHNLGATVVGVAGGAAKVARVRELGADIAVDYTADDWTQAVRDALGGREITVALDGVGGALGRGALELLGIAGRLALFGWSSGEPTEVSTGDLYSRGLTVTVPIGPRMMRRPDALRELEERALAEAASGRVEPVIGQVFPLAGAAEAHTALETRGTMGKVVLRP